MFHRVLVIATEWFSHHGGVSSFNRAFCRETARLGHAVACLVARASDNEVSDAAGAGVQLFFHRTSLDGLSDRERLCLPGAIPNAFAPTVIVGHGHVSGPAAKALQSSVFPAAKRIHFFHTSPFGIEPHKDANIATGFSTRATKKEELERRLGVSADAIVTVGPRLDSEWRTNLNGAFPRDRIHQVVPGITERGDALEPPPANQCLILGRMEDWKLKGLDIAARAVALLQSNDGERRLRPVLVVRGVEPESVGVIEGQLKAMCGPQLQVRVKPYTADAEALLQDLRSAAVVMMPSREEGFGLVGLEALAAGVPLLISDRSGLGDLLSDRGDRDGVVTMVTNDDDVDVKVWSEAIARVLSHKADAFAHARALAARIQEARYFESTVAPIFNGLEAEQPPPIPPASTPPPDGPATLEAVAKISAPAAILAAFAELETDLRLTAATGARYSAPNTVVNDLVGSGRLSQASGALILRLAKFRKETIHRETAATEGQALAFIAEAAEAKKAIAHLVVTDQRGTAAEQQLESVDRTLRKALEQRGIASYLISRPIKAQLHCSYVRRSRTSIELQGEILAILAGLTGDADGYEELALLVHRPTAKPKVNYLDFEPIELACRLSMKDAVAFARSEIGERDVWSRINFVGVKEPTTPNRSLVRIEFPFIGEGS